MTTWMRNLSVLGVAVFLAVASTGCDDDSPGGGPPVSTTTTSSTTTTAPETTTTSTSSTSTTSVTVTTVTSTTTTTTGGGGQCACEVTFGVTNTETLGALQYSVSYAGVGGGFDGAGAAVDCTALAGSFTAFNDVEATTTLTAATIDAAGFATPADVSRCRYTRPGLVEPVAADFPITITDQSRPDFTPANATMAVTNIGCICSGGSTTTTTGPTTTTSTTTGTNTTTTTGGTGTLYNVAIDLNDPVLVGALQFDVNYSAAGGQFTGSGPTVACSSAAFAAAGGFASFNDVEATTTVSVAGVSVTGVQGPITVANCEFDSPTAPAPGDFVITVVDASAPDLNPIVPTPSVTVSAVTPK